MDWLEFRDLVTSWDLPESFAERCWHRCWQFLEHVTPEEVEQAFRNAMAQIEAESKHHAN